MPKLELTTIRISSQAAKNSGIVIAMALVLQSMALILGFDEPTTALDVTVQAEILDLLRSCPRRIRRFRADYYPRHG